MALEQRIGRVDRIGQNKVVKAINLVLEDSVEFRIREVLERKLAVIFEEFGIDKTSDVLDSEGGAHIFDKLFVDALLNPERIESEVAEVTEEVKREAAWNREQLSVIAHSDDDDRESLRHAVSTQPLRDYLDLLVRSHVEAEGGEYTASSSGVQVRWPDEERSRTYCFAGSGESQSAELLTLDHPRIRQLLDAIPRFLKGDPIPALTLDDLPGGKGGFWSLWQLRFATSENTRQAFFPVFTQTDGRVFDRMAEFIWDRLLNGTFEVEAGRYLDDREETYELHATLAEKAGRPVFDNLKAVHESYLHERERNGRRHFEVRFQQLNHIGLPEVRQFRQRQLELEQVAWRQDMAAQRRIRPELNPLILLKVHTA